ncbi:MAG: AEC family transporter [Rhodospirillaceae bacterium]|nr:AEC family transporter [Rhodospirillaceae bacterium]
MQAVVSIVLPVFGIILVGYLAGRMRLLGPASSEALNGFVYWVSLPALFLLGLAKAPLDRIFDLPLIAAFLGGIAVIFVLALAVARVLFPGRLGAVALHALTASFPNSGYMGIPLFLLAFGEGGSLPVIVANVSQSITVFFLAIFLIELDGGSGHLGRRVAKIAINLLLNPFLIAAALGLGLNAAGIGLGGPFETLVRTLANAASPCALFALGLFMVGKPITRGLPEVSWLAFAKLILHPAVTWLIAVHLFALPADTVRALVLIAAMPTGALVFVVAQRYNVFVQRGSAAVLISTILSVLTISALMVLYHV